MRCCCRTYILPEDLEHFLEPDKAQQAFDILDVDGDGQVTLHNIRDAVVSIYQVSSRILLRLSDLKAFSFFETIWCTFLSCRDLRAPYPRMMYVLNICRVQHFHASGDMVKGHLPLPRPPPWPLTTTTPLAPPHKHPPGPLPQPTP